MPHSNKQNKKEDKDLPEVYKAVFEHAGTAFVVTDGTGCVRDLNAAARVMFGYTAADLKGRPIGDILKKKSRVEDSHSPPETDTVAGVRKDGELFTCRLASHTFTGADGQTWTCMELKAQPDTRRSDKPGSPESADSLYYRRLDKLEGEVLKKNLAGESLVSILETYVKGVEELHPGMLCSILKREGDKLYNLASPGLPASYIEAIDGLPVGEKQGACGTAAFRKEKVIISNAESDPLTENFLHLVEKYGFKALWSYPVFDSGHRVTATFAAYYYEQREPAEHEEKTIRRAAQLVQLILQNHSYLKALDESNQRFHYVNRATRHAVYEWDINEDRLFCGAGFESLFGYEPAGRILTKAEREEMIHPADLEQVRRSLREALHNKKRVHWSSEYRVQTADGSHAIVEENAYILRAEDGTARKMIGAMLDVTERKREEQHLKLLESVVTRTHDAVLITKTEPLDAPKGPEIVYVNEAFENMTGYTAAEVIGKTPRILQGANTDGEILAEFGKTIRQRKPAEAETVNYKKNGDEFWVHFSAVPVADASGRYTHFISVARDITERKNEELKQKLSAEISLAFNDEASVAGALQACMEKITEMFGFAAAEIWLTDMNEEFIRLSAFHSAAPEFDRFYEDVEIPLVFKKGEGLPGETWAKKKKIFWKHLGGRKNVVRKKAVHEAGFRTAFSFPIIHNEKFLGALLIGLGEDIKQERYYSPMFTEIAVQLGGEITRKRLEVEREMIFESVPDIIGLAGTDGFFKKMNSGAEKLLGYSEEELLSVPFVDFIHPGDRKRTLRETQSQKEGHSTAYFENRYITAEGKIVWLAWSATPPNEEGLMYIAGKDITDKKETEHLLEQANRLAKIGSWEYDLQEGKVYWSEVTRKIHEIPPGFTPDPANVLDFYKAGTSRNRMKEALEQAIRQGVSWDLEVQIMTAKGNERWVRTIGQPETVQDKVVRIYGSFQDIDRQKKAEIAYKEASEERIKILESISDAFYAIDRDWKFTYFNKEAEHLLAKKAEQMIGKNIWEEFAPARETKLFGIYHEVMDTGKSQSFEYYYPPLETWFDISVFGTEDGISVYFKNINERIETQARIVEKSRQLDAIAEFNGLLLSCGHWKEAVEKSLEIFGRLMDADRVYMFQNHIDKRGLTGYTGMILEWTKEGVTPEIDRPFHRNVPFDLIREFTEPLSRNRIYSIALSEITDPEFRNILEEQQIQSIFAVPVFTGNLFRGFIGFDDCRRERRWNEEEISFLKTIALNLGAAIENEDGRESLKEAYEEKNEILESIGDSFFAVNSDWTVTYWNNMAEQTLGMPRENVVGKKLWDVYHDAIELDFYEQYQKAMNEKVKVHFEEYYPGTEMWFEVSAYPASDGLSVYFKDVTERKLAEARLKELNRSLEEHAGELAASNAELEQFAFVASHDLQEPLRMITSFLARLERKYDGVLDEKARQYIHFATDGARRMRQIILDLLEYSRVGRQPFERENVDLNELVEEILLLQKQRMDEKHATVTYDDLPVVYAARSPLRQVLQNLISNGLKYQPPDAAPEITIACTETDDFWTIAVRDNGIGIEKEYQEKIFHIFQRLHTKEEYSGTGMGLAICRKIVEEHGGTLSVQSVPGNGSTFCFTLPKKEANSRIDAEAE